MRPAAARRAPDCRDCRFFTNDPELLEKELTGILILSSTYGSTRGEAGLCSVRDTFQGPVTGCPDFQPRPTAD